MNKLPILKSAVAIAIAGFLLIAPVSANAAGEKILWTQSFNEKAGTKVDPKIWSYNIGAGGWGNNEHQAYTNHNATLTGSGALALKLQRIVVDQSDLYETCPIDTPGNACEFESARIQTKGKLNFQYGRLEARIKVPVGDGTWPAFWLLGSDISTNAWPNCGEIDIMETKGSEPYTVHGTAHGPGYSGGDGIVNTRTISARLGSGYHIYALDWTKNKMQWSIDGKIYHTVTPSVVGNHSYVFNKPMFMILNVAAGGWFAGDIDPDLNSAQMSVDYIRYYSINGQGRVTGSSSAIAAGKP